jgi:hypothetical protein
MRCAWDKVAQANLATIAAGRGLERTGERANSIARQLAKPIGQRAPTIAVHPHMSWRDPGA